MSLKQSNCIFRETLLILFVVIFFGNTSSQNLLPTFYLENNFNKPILNSINAYESLSKTRDYKPGFYRLPNNSIPLNYDLTITTNVHKKDMNFNGIVLIDVKILENTPAITLHYNSLNITNVKISKISDINSGTETPQQNYDDLRNFFTLTRENNETLFEKDSNWQLNIEYTGKLRTDNRGFYLSSYTDKDNTTQ